jgi:tetratricopeptide (TPR) repeat protein
VVARTVILLAAACLALCGQINDDPARGPLEAAYSALEASNYDAAIQRFLEAARIAPASPAIRKDLAYAYLKTGETEAAREQFAAAVRLDPGDFHTALEYAFLCHETGRTQEARRIFDELRKKGDPDSRATAEQAFQSIDRPLKEGIERWGQAARTNPGDFNAHRELAMLAERRDDLALAAEHYLAAWRLRPEQRSLLVDLGRTWQAMGRVEEAHSALLAASRGGEPRAAEAARGLLPPRDSYVYEFKLALDLDPGNTGLRRELGSLLAAMGRNEEAEKTLASLPPPRLEEARDLADRSYQAGYLRDALKYYSIAQQADPSDARLMLQLGWTYNLMKQDAQAYYWFGRARRSPDPAIAAEATKAYGNLRPSVAWLRTTVWFYPTYSSRWRDTFAYGQLKLEWKLGRLPLRAYITTRLVGDTRRMSGGANPQYLSQSSVIFGAGLATSYWHGLMLWAEAGRAASYLDSRRNLPRSKTDYRGGFAFSKGIGKLLGSEDPGVFFETNADGVFMSYFRNDFVLYSQNRFGYTLAPAAALGGLQTQWYWAVNASADARRQYWAKLLESGPGVRFRWRWMPSSWLFSAGFFRGDYVLTESNPWGRRYQDLRVGFWYALTR